MGRARPPSRALTAIGLVQLAATSTILSERRATAARPQSPKKGQVQLQMMASGALLTTCSTRRQSAPSFSDDSSSITHACRHSDGGCRVLRAVRGRFRTSIHELALEDV